MIDHPQLVFINFGGQATITTQISLHCIPGGMFVLGDR